MNRNVFEIQGLECVYHLNGNKERKVVLEIESLSIPMGKVTMILGQSGSGKSTLIETLGLMNNTISKGLIFFYHGDNIIRISKDIWKRPSELATIRNRHYSFIFQNDFLMPYYSPEENILIGRLIQGSRSFTENDTAELRKLCLKMGLNFDEINKKRPSELSVGQRQRLSFIRAIIKKHAVIFGDEPTGNLDEIHSGLLLDFLNNAIQQDDRLSAVLVSHNIPLSISKADYIIVLSPAGGDRYEIRQENVFSKTAAGWLNGSKVNLSDDQLAGKIRAAANIFEQVN